MPGNDGITFHMIQEQDESKSIGVESLTVGAFVTQGDNQGRGGGHGLGCGSGCRPGHGQSWDNGLVQHPMFPLSPMWTLCI